MKRYTTTMPENGLSIEKRRALFFVEEELFKDYRFDEESGTVQLLSTNVSPWFRVDPLHLAAMFGDVDQALHCIENHIDVNLEGRYLHSFSDIRMTPLVCAILARHEDMVRLLISRGARLSRKNDEVSNCQVMALVHRWFVLQDGASSIHGMVTCLKYLGWNINSPVNLMAIRFFTSLRRPGPLTLREL
jgi:ankyrin repeat protein